MQWYQFLLAFHFKPMRIFLLICMMWCSLFFAFQDSFAECPPADKASAIDFIKWCAEWNIWVSTAGSTWITWVKELIISIAERAFQFAALFAVGAIVWAWIKYTTAYGDDEKIKSAKSTIIYAVIGLIIVLASFPLVATVVNFVYSLWGG